MAAFKVKENESVDRWVEADERLWVTADGQKVVSPDDPDAAFLYAVPGQRISRDDAERYGLVKGRSRHADKQRAPEGDKQGTVADVLEEVGDDPAEAQAALEAERTSKKPRATLIEKLERLADGGDAP